MFLSAYFFEFEKRHFPAIQPSTQEKDSVFQCCFWDTVTLCYMKQYNVSLFLDIPQKMQILVLVNTLGDTKAMRHINTWHWRKRQSGSETAFLIGTKFHRKQCRTGRFFAFKSYSFFISLKITKNKEEVKFEKSLENTAFWVWDSFFFSFLVVFFKSFMTPVIFKTLAARWGWSALLNHYLKGKKMARIVNWSSLSIIRTDLLSFWKAPP